MILLEQQLTAAGYDLAAIAAENEAIAKWESEKLVHELNFLKAWNLHLSQLNRAGEPEFSIVNGKKVRTPTDQAAYDAQQRSKRAMSPLDKAKAKIAQLEYKLERERFRVQWIEEQQAIIQQQAAQQQQQQAVVA